MPTEKSLRPQTFDPDKILPQSEDRVHRLGEHTPITYIDLLTGQTVDERRPMKGPENRALQQGKSRLLTAREKSGLSIMQAAKVWIGQPG